MINRPASPPAAGRLSGPPWTSSHPPAPGNLRLVQAFVNTVDLEAGAESLHGPASLAAWLTSWGLVPPDVTTDEATLRLALELREGLREVLGGHAGEPVERSASPRLTAVAAALPLRVGFEDGRPRLVAVEEGVRGGLARILAVAAAAAADGSWERLKVCHRHDCRWAFFDFSKNRRGRWCSMRSCGNAAAARAYRRRRAERAGD